MNNTKTHPLLFVLMLCSLWLSSCGEKTKEDCAKHIEEKIRKGASFEVAQAKLKECGFKTTLEPAKNIVYADKVVEGKPVSERTQVIIRLDSDRRVVDVRVSTGLIAP
jgi:hypothetical protein